MADQLEALLRRSPLTQSQRADVWDAYESTQDSDALAAKLTGLNVPKQVKASLWDLKEASAKPAASAVEVEAFPTPGQTAGTFLGSAVRSLPGMAVGMVQAAAAPFVQIPNEAHALVTGAPSPTMTALRESAGHARAALAPGEAGPGRRLAEAASAIPGAAPIVQGAERILTPAYKTATEGVGTVTPGEMKAAAETGGAATAALAMPEIAKGVSNVSPATVGKVLKFTAKHAMGEVVAPGKTLAGKIIVTALSNPKVREKLGTIFQDRVIGAIDSGNLPKAAEILTKALEKNPEAAALHAKDVAAAVSAEASKVGAVADGPATVPEMAPATARTFSPTDNSPAAVEARNSAKRARRGTLVQSQARAESRGTIVATPVVEQAVETLAKRATMPVKGNVKPATVYTKPATKPIDGRPLTPKQREMRLKQLEAAQAAGLDIWEVFGTAKDN